MDKNRCSTNATKEAFGPPQQSEGARRVQSPEAMAIEDNPPGPTKQKTLAIGGGFCLGAKLDETDDSGSTKSDHRRILVAKGAPKG